MKIIQSNKKSDIKVLFTNKTIKNNSTLKNSKFNGKKGQLCIVNNTLFVGTKNVKTKDDWREVGFSITRKLKNSVFSLFIEIPYKSQEFIEGLYLGMYEFNKYKNNFEKNTLSRINLKCSKNILKIIKVAKIKVNAQILTRNWVNKIPEEAYSESISKSVIKEFKYNPFVKVTIYDEKDLKKFNMRGHLAVNRASRHEAKTIKIEYNPKTLTNEKHIVLVGKGLTYDSGGLSLKPANHMVNMKCDKAGAMTVLGIMKGISELNKGTKVTAYMALAENMIDGSSYKPDDVIKMKNGKTVHVKNTDAEGRIVLFDNICLSQEENHKIDEIYTFATLTGAAVSQFGNEATAMVGFNDKMKENIKHSGESEGEIFMNAEFHKYMMKSVDDSLADLSNLGTPNMGCQKAGLFLTNAITKKNKNKYLHLDIAGPAFIEKEFGTNVVGGTGVTVRTFLEYIK